MQFFPILSMSWNNLTISNIRILIWIFSLQEAWWTICLLPVAPETHLYHPLEMVRLPFKKYLFLKKIFVKYLRDKHKLTWREYCFHYIKYMRWNSPQKSKKCQLFWTSSSWSSSKWLGATQLKANDASSAGLLTKCTTRTETNKGSGCQERSSLIIKSRSKRISGLLKWVD